MAIVPSGRVHVILRRMRRAPGSASNFFFGTTAGSVNALSSDVVLLASVLHGNRHGNRDGNRHARELMLHTLADTCADPCALQGHSDHMTMLLALM